MTKKTWLSDAVRNPGPRNLEINMKTGIVAPAKGSTGKRPPKPSKSFHRKGGR